MANIVFAYTVLLLQVGVHLGKKLGDSIGAFAPETVAESGLVLYRYLPSQSTL